MMRGLRVLVVDDEFLIADYVADVLEDAGHTVVGTADSGTAALAIMGREALDVAVIDISLRGEMDGIELAGHLREAEIPFIFITGSGDPTTKARAMEKQPLAFLQKPFNEGHLLKALQAMAGK